MSTLSTKELAELLGCHPRNAVRTAQRLGIEVLVLGHRTRRFRTTDVERAIARTAEVPRHEAQLPRTALAGRSPAAGVSRGPRVQRTTRIAA
jgi:excisionase family DNA binding protein